MFNLFTYLLCLFIFTYTIVKNNINVISLTCDTEESKTQTENNNHDIEFIMVCSFKIRYSKGKQIVELDKCVLKELPRKNFELEKTFFNKSINGIQKGKSQAFLILLKEEARNYEKNETKSKHWVENRVARRKRKPDLLMIKIYKFMIFLLKFLFEITAVNDKNMIFSKIIINHKKKNDKNENEASVCETEILKNLKNRKRNEEKKMKKKMAVFNKGRNRF
ncbi:hypothetical protein GVAV_000093 [Gurleya vavrai]